MIETRTKIAIFWLSAIGIAWLFTIFDELGFFLIERGHGHVMLALAVVATVWALGQLMLAYLEGQFSKPREETNGTRKV